MKTTRTNAIAALVAALSVGLVACSRTTDDEADPVLEPAPAETDAATPAAADPEPDEKPTEDVAEPAGAEESLLARRVSFQFVGAAATDVVRYVGQSQGINIVVAPAVTDTLDTTAVNVKLTDVTVGAALRVVARLTGTGLATEGDGVTITTAAAGTLAAVEEPSAECTEQLDKPLTVDFVESSPQDIANYVAMVTGVNVVLLSTTDAPLSTDGVSLKLEETDARRVLGAMSKLMGARIEIRDDIVFVVPE